MRCEVCLLTLLWTGASYDCCLLHARAYDACKDHRSPRGYALPHQASTTKRLTTATPGRLRRPSPSPPCAVQCHRLAVYLRPRPGYPTCSRWRRNTPAQSRFVSRQGTDSRRAPRACGIPGPASDLAQLHLITAISPPRVRRSWVALALFAASPPTLDQTADVIRHGIRDQVPRGLRRRRRV